MAINKASTQTWVWRSMVRSALIPLVLVETVLIAIYLLSNHFIREANLNYIYQKADMELELSAQREANVIREQLLSITRQTEIFRARTQQVLSSNLSENIETEAANLALAPSGVLYSKADNGNAASFYSSIIPPEKQDKNKIYKLSQLDPLMREIKAQNPLLAAIYFNSWDSYNRIYPWFETEKQYPHDMDIPKYNFYYLADETHNPLRNAIWTEVYIDPAGQGWMASCIAPVYKDNFLEGVVGLDVTVSTIIDQIVQFEIPWHGYAILASNDGTIMAMPPKGETDFGLKELTKHTYSEVISSEIFKPEQFNLFSRSDTSSIAANMRSMKAGKGSFVLNNGKKLIAWTTIPETHWKLITIVDEKDLYSETNDIAKQFQQIGYLMIGGLLLFYTIFMSYIWYRAQHMSKKISEPLLGIQAMIQKISQEDFIQKKPDFELAELDQTAESIVAMGHRLGKVTDDLKVAKESAEEANKTKTIFLSSMSHELRTPLNAILGFGQLLQNDQFKFTDMQRREYASEIITAGNHLLTLIDDVLNLSTIDQKNSVIDTQSVNIIDICWECIEMSRPSLLNRSITLSTQLPSHGVCVYGEPTRIRQVILNLLSNAVKYNKKEGQIIVSAEPQGHMYRITIKDTGAGIPADKQSQIFQPFNRLGYETSAVEGTGIGLAISKQLVEIMHGNIGFESIPDEGTSFWFELLLTEMQDDKKKDVYSSSQRMTLDLDVDEKEQLAELASHPCVLLLSQNRQLFEQMKFSSSEISPIFATSLEQARTYMLDEHRPQVVIADLQDEIDELKSFLYQLKEMNLATTIPVIAITDAISSVSDDSDLKKYINYTLFSPVNVHHAWAVIKKMLK